MLSSKSVATLLDPPLMDLLCCFFFIEHHKVGLIWGQNEAFNQFGKSVQEPRLGYFCSKEIYDVIILRGLVGNVWEGGIGIYLVLD